LKESPTKNVDDSMLKEMKTTKIKKLICKVTKAKREQDIGLDVGSEAIRVGEYRR
jgi:hypothetical protein